MSLVQSINEIEIPTEDSTDHSVRVNTSHLHRYVEIRGVNINYAKVGHGTRGILLLNGSLGHIDSDFGQILSKFSADKFTIVAWDYPGCGKSRPPNRDFSSKATFIHNDADFGFELMKKLGFEKFSILGWCYGGVVAVHLAAKHPESVHALIICGSRSHFTKEDLNFYNGIRDISTWSAHVKAAMMNGYEEEYFVKCWNDLNDFYIHNFNTDNGKLCQDELSQVKSRTLLIHGAMDPVAPIQHAHFSHEKIPNSALIIVPTGKHTLHLKCADEFIGHVEEFIQKNV